MDGQIITTGLKCGQSLDPDQNKQTLAWRESRSWMLIESRYGLVWKSCCRNPRCATCNDDGDVNDVVVGRIGMVKGLWGKKLKK